MVPMPVEEISKREFMLQSVVIFVMTIPFSALFGYMIVHQSRDRIGPRWDVNLFSGWIQVIHVLFWLAVVSSLSSLIRGVMDDPASLFANLLYLFIGLCAVIGITFGAFLADEGQDKHAQPAAQGDVGKPAAP